MCIAIENQRTCDWKVGLQFNVSVLHDIATVMWLFTLLFCVELTCHCSSWIEAQSKIVLVIVLAVDIFDNEFVQGSTAINFCRQAIIWTLNVLVKLLDGLGGLMICTVIMGSRRLWLDCWKHQFVKWNFKGTFQTKTVTLILIVQEMSKFEKFVTR